MNYNNIVKAEFMDRPNRFIANVLLKGMPVAVHVKNTGRCTELLTKGAVVYLEKSGNPNRKTAYSLIAAEKKNRIVNIDSYAPNIVVGEALRSGLVLSGMKASATKVKSEAVFGDSRFDFYIENQEISGYVEVKGATLEENGVVRFPDAPTERGVKHLKELIQVKKQGMFAAVVFVIQMSEALYFTPNYAMHFQFGKILEEANRVGVAVAAFDCIVTKDSMILNKPVDILLENG